MLKKYSGACLLTFLLVSAEIITASNVISQNALEKQSRWDDGLGITADVNDYVDETVSLLVPLLQKYGLDPMGLPELVEGFEVKPLFITYSAWLKIHDGTMTGLVNVQRDGDQKVSYLANMLRIRLKLKFTDLKIVYKYLVKVMNLGPTGGIKATFSKFSIVVDILIDFNNDEIQLQEFSLTDKGKLTAKLTGNILTDWLVNPVIKVFMTLFNTIIINVVVANIRNFAEDMILDINRNIKTVTAFLESFN